MFSDHPRMLWVFLWDLDPLKVSFILTFVLNEGNKYSSEVAMSFYDQLYVYDLNALLSQEGLKDMGSLWNGRH